ncbi:MAG: DEAD/DEAH box helicase family protein, partial [Candidatus Nanohaloarchaea archaeon]
MDFAILDGVGDRDYQLETAAELLDHPDENYVVNMPVGGGKTETALELIAAAHNSFEDYSAIVVSPNRRVEDQWYDRIREYGLDEILDVSRNRPRDTEHGMVGTHFRSEDGGRDLHQRRKRVENWERQRRNNDKHEDFLDSDVVLTTYQLLDSDVRNDRIDDEILSKYDDIIIDEATHFVAVDNVGPEVGKQFRTNRYFDRFYDALGDDTRTVGLTAMYGGRMEAVQDQLDARLVRPSQERVDRYRPDIERLEPNLAIDTDIVYMLSDIRDQYRKTRHAIGRELGRDQDVNIYTLQALTDREDSIGREARRALKL